LLIDFGVIFCNYLFVPSCFKLDLSIINFEGHFAQAFALMGGVAMKIITVQLAVK